MTISIGIPTYNRSFYLINTINSVLQQRHHAVIEIIVIDQSTDENKDHFYKSSIQQFIEKKQIDYLTSKIANLPKARNEILKVAKGDLILWLDDDVLLPKGFIEAHLGCYTKGRCENRVLGVAGLPFHRNLSHKIDPAEISMENYHQYTIPHYSEKEVICNWAKPMIGANHSVLRMAAVETGGYDESMTGPYSYYEDADFTKRLCATFPEGSIMYNPSASLVHLKAPAGGCRIVGTKAKVTWLNTLSTHIFMWRHTKKIKWFILLMATVRMGPLRKENVIRFWRQPIVWAGFIKSLVISFRRRKSRKYI